ncbi:MAG: PepSY1/2 domain-containing protein [Acutalibacteraceae bacterium]|nr:germination protein YpeB [Oscillospiraceae bacterium]
MKTSNLTRKQIRLISFCLTAIAVLLATTVSFFLSSQSYKKQVELSRQRALSELSESVDAIVIVLEKGRYSADAENMSKISSSLNAEARCAKAALSEIESSEIYTADIYKFLSQIGDYTSSVTTKLASDSAPSGTDSENLAFLLSYAKELSSSLSSIRSSYYDGSLTFEKSKTNLSLYDSSDSVLFSDSMVSAEQGFQDYPSLIYDGPFSDHMGSREPKCVKELPEATRTEAGEYAAKILGIPKNKLREESDECGELYLYCFSSDSKTVGITKKGCKLCYIVNSGYEGESTISQTSAAERGEKYLSGLGYDNMKSSYYSTYDGVCTVNYAYVENGVVCYPDLIKVGVSLETGEIVSFDARTYLMNHTQRKLAAVEKDKLGEAKKKLNKELEVIDSKTALIPTQSDREYLCFEFHCRDKQKQEVLVYIDCETLQERDILLLLYTDGGVLTE